MTDLITSIKSTYENADFSKIASHSVFAGVSRADFKTRNAVTHWLTEKLKKKHEGAKDPRAAARAEAGEAWKVHRIIQETGDPHLPREAREFVARYVAHHNITANFKGKLSRPRAGLTAPDIDASMVCTQLDDISQELDFRFGQKALSNALALELKDVRDTIRETTFADIAQPVDVASAWGEWERLVHATAILGTGPGEVSARYAIRVMQTTIWLTKRKLVMDAALPVEGHLMPVLWGGQGGGKTECSRLFFSPVADMVAEANFGDVVDKKNHDLAGMPIAFLDEMEKADKADVEAIKNAITSKERSSRIHHSHGMAHMDNRTTFWGCTNKTLGETINDTTGLRRFGPYPFRFAPTGENIASGLPVADWPTIAAIDYLLLWRSVDHTAGHPLLSDAEAVQEWRTLTEQERPRDSAEEWLRQVPDRLQHEWCIAAADFKTGVVGYPGDAGQFMAADLFQCYRIYCEASRTLPLSMPMWGRRMNGYERSPWFPFTPARRVSAGMVRSLKSAQTPSPGEVIAFPATDTGSTPPSITGPGALPKLTAQEFSRMLRERR